MKVEVYDKANDIINIFDVYDRQVIYNGIDISDLLQSLCFQKSEETAYRTIINMAKELKR